jgi:predicted Zn-dependent protease
MLQRFLCLALLLLLAGCAVNPVTGRNELALMSISPQEEIEIGRKTFPEVLQQMGGEYPDAALETYVNQVGTRMGKISHRPELPYQFRVVNDSTPNAFALPGGYIAISRGLLVGLQNEAQLASVLGHEIGHVTARHSVQGMQRASMLNLGVAVLGAAADTTGYGGLARPAGDLAANLINNTYSREQESESDRLGIDYMVKVGYDPLGSVQVQEYFYRKVENGANPDWLSGLFRSHPFSRDRMVANQQYVQTSYSYALENPRYVLAVDPFQRATAHLRQVEPGYQLYVQAQQQERKGDLNGAIATYLQAAAQAPDETLILTGLGMAYLKAEDIGSARRHLSRAVQLHDQYYLPQLGLGYAYQQQSLPQKAIPHLERSMELYPTAQGAFLLAEGYEQTGRKKDALKLYQSVAQADPGGKLGQAAAKRIAGMQGQ